VTRWNRRLLFGVLAVLVPALAGCEAGLNAPTLEFHPAAFGAYTDKNGISISNAFVLGPPLHGPAVAGGRAGVFLSITAENGDRLVSVSAPGTAAAGKITGGSVNLPAQVPVNLTGPVPRVVLVALANPLQGGETVTLNFTFAEAGAVTLAVPVEPQAYEYSTFSPPPSPSPTAKPKPTSTVASGGPVAPSGSASASIKGATSSGSAAASPSP
jgi:copper(I)-binding protein